MFTGKKSSCNLSVDPPASNNTMLDMKKDNIKAISLIRQNSIHDCILYAASLLQTSMTGLFICVCIDKLNKSEKNPLYLLLYRIAALANSLLLMMVPYGRYQSRQKHGLHFFNAEEEIIRSREVRKNKCHFLDLLRYSDDFSSDQSTSNRLYFSFFGSNRQRQSVWWEVGKSELLNQSKRLEYILKNLSLELQSSTRALSKWRKFLPHVNYIGDLPSKARVCSPLFIDAAAALFSSLLLKSSSSFFNSLYWLKFAIFSGVQIAENYILNDRKLQYQLEGYDEIFGGYFDKYPTCIGQQISAEFTLVPNSTLKETVAYLTEGYEKLMTHTNQMEKLPEKLKTEIEIFMGFYKEHFCNEELCLDNKVVHKHP
jgi:hypothetical protein